MRSWSNFLVINKWVTFVRRPEIKAVGRVHGMSGSCSCGKDGPGPDKGPLRKEVCPCCPSRAR